MSAPMTPQGQSSIGARPPLGYDERRTVRRLINDELRRRGVVQVDELGRLVNNGGHR